MISVIIPTYNRGRCIARSIDSVLNQTYSDLEVIVVDDGSTDNTRAIVEAYQDSRVRYILQERSGACAARNRGIDEARGEYIAFQDSDDTWCADKLEIQFSALLEKNADIVFSGFRRGVEGADEFELFPPDELKPDGDAPLTICNLLPGNICSTQTLLMKKECLMDERFDVNMPRLQDWDLMLRLVPKWRTYYVDGFLSTIYVQNDSISTNNQAYLVALQKISIRILQGYIEQYKTLSQQQCVLGEITSELAHYKEHYQAAIGQREALKAELNQLRLVHFEVVNSTCWKITKPIRYVLDHWKTFMFRHETTSQVYRGMRYLWHNGLFRTCKKMVLYFRSSSKKEKKMALRAEREYQFHRKVKFSILVPLYNTPERFLREMIKSVQDQTYGNWELCLADGSDNAHSEVGKVCMQYARKDSRILYKKLERNLGISGNTNVCIEMSTGDYISLFDHDDLLHPSALFEVMKAICEQNADLIYTDENTFHNTPADAFCPNYKPDYAPDTLRSYNYICHFTSFARSLMVKAGGGFRSEFDGSQDYDIILRLTEQAEHIVHIPKILYYWRSHANSVASDINAKPYTLNAAKLALSQHLNRIGLKGDVLDSVVPSTYKISYEIEGEPLVSILIPNYEHKSVLETCLNSIYEKSTYRNFEVIVIENNSSSPEIFDYYEKIKSKWSNMKVVAWNDKFNFSAINNFGAQYANGDILLLLNNDIEVITPDWLEQMLMFAQRKDVGAVGSMLYYPDDTVQHGGVILGIGGVAGHAHKYFQRGDYGYMSRLTIAQNYSCVTAACVMMRRAVWDEIGGIDDAFAVAFNDVDMCMRIRKAGYLVVWTPYAELYHHESKSRGPEDTPEKQRRFQREVLRFQECWEKELKAGDPYYNPNLTLEREDFSFK